MNKLKKITKEEFAELYYKHTVKELAKMLDVSTVTINNWRKKLNLLCKITRLDIK